MLFHGLKKNLRESLRYLYKNRTLGYSKLVRHARKIESELKENKSDVIKLKVAVFKSNAEGSPIELLVKNIAKIETMSNADLNAMFGKKVSTLPSQLDNLEDLNGNYIKLTS